MGYGKNVFEDLPSFYHLLLKRGFRGKAEVENPIN
jgi:hypothetical protein